VAVISETLARHVFPGQNPLGKQLRISGETRDVIGIAKDSRYISMRGEMLATIYQPFVQTNTGRGQMALYVRAIGDPRALIPRIREAVQSVDPQLPVFEVHTLAQEIDAVLIRERLMATLSGTFSLLALVLACVGLYGLFAFVTVQRTREIGICIALGAQRRTIMWTVMREVFTLLIIGTMIGIPVALIAAQWSSNQISGLLYGVRPIDAVATAAATVALLVSAGLAGYLPARRASRVDPMVALRNE
jgi:ABC-type antimicrobial peptide transport system permease subunit